MTDDEQKAALETIEAATKCRPGSGVILDGGEACTIKAMLAEPRLPKEPTPEMLKLMSNAHYRPLSTTTATIGIDYQRAAYRALYAHLTAPVDDLEEIRRYGT